MALHLNLLKKRADFLNAARGIKKVRTGFVLQMAQPYTQSTSIQNKSVKAQTAVGPTRFGFTASKKIGNAPQRNRVKRRLRALVQELEHEKVPQGFDFVLVARRAALSMPFEQLKRDLTATIHSAVAQTVKDQGETFADGA